MIYHCPNCPAHTRCAYCDTPVRDAFRAARGEWPAGVVWLAMIVAGMVLLAEFGK